MCSSPKSSGSTKVSKPHYGGIMSGLDQQTRMKFTERANAAADKRDAKAKRNIKDKRNVKDKRKVRSWTYMDASLSSNENRCKTITSIVNKFASIIGISH